MGRSCNTTRWQWIRINQSGWWTFCWLQQIRWSLICWSSKTQKSEVIFLQVTISTLYRIHTIKLVKARALALNYSCSYNCVTFKVDTGNLASWGVDVLILSTNRVICHILYWAVGSSSSVCLHNSGAPDLWSHAKTVSSYTELSKQQTGLTSEISVLLFLYY